MSEHPPGWARAAIGDIGEVRLGRQRSPDRATGAHMRPYMRAANVTWKGINVEDVKAMDFSPGEFEVFALKPGDVLVGEASGSRLEVGKSAIWRGEVSGACFQNTLIRVRTNEVVLPEYLQKHLTHDALRGALAEISKGIGIHHLGAAGLAGWQIAIAPLSEQKRIVGKLDALLARVEVCREHLNRVPGILKRFRQAVLAAATSGELTREWRDERGRDFDWEAATFGSTGAVNGGITKNSGRTNAALTKKYLRVANVYANRLELDDIAEIGTTPGEYARTRLRAGDVLIVEGNGSIDQIGRAALWRGEIRECAHQNHLIRWRSGGSVAPEFALYWLLSPTGRMSLVEFASSTTGLHTLSLSKVSAVPLALPPMDEQLEIVRRVSDLLELAEHLEVRVARVRGVVDRSTSSVLAKAFRGELVPQDPSDEPASALLARLRSEREATATPPRRRARTHA